MNHMIILALIPAIAFTRIISEMSNGG